MYCGYEICSLPRVFLQFLKSNFFQFRGSMLNSSTRFQNHKSPLLVHWVFRDCVFDVFVFPTISHIEFVYRKCSKNIWLIQGIWHKQHNQEQQSRIFRCFSGCGLKKLQWMLLVHHPHLLCTPCFVQAHGFLSQILATCSLALALSMQVP